MIIPTKQVCTVYNHLWLTQGGRGKEGDTKHKFVYLYTMEEHKNYRKHQCVGVGNLRDSD